VSNYFTDGKSTNADQVLSVLEKHVADDDWLAKLFITNLTVVFWGYPMVINAVT
jgi:hypothetical protein